MLKKVFVWILAAMLALSNVGCTSVPQPTMEELLAEVNAEHQEVEKGTINASQYVGDLVDQDLRWSYYPKENTAEYDSEKILTQQQAIEDVTYLFDAFHDCYGPYEYFGGAEVFDAVEETIKAELQTKETLIAADLEQILLENLAFIKDGHFSINMKRANPTKIPFFFREVAFVKTEEGYQAIDGRKVESVEGYDNLNELMKRSISQEGKLVYYPVLLKDCDFWEALKSPQTCDETLTIHYSNGDTQELTAEPYQIYTEMDLQNPENNQITKFYEDENIPVFQFNQFAEKHIEEILDGATKLKDAPIAILDLRSNTGGDGEIPSQWLNQYTGKIVPSNQYYIDTKLGRKFNDRRDNWIENDNLLIILVGKYSASASELFLDYSYNLENTLIVGENSNGSLVGTSGKISLPNSGCQIDVGGGRLCVLSEENDCFEELRGFYPDIWVPAGEAEELAVKLIENLK